MRRLGRTLLIGALGTAVILRIDNFTNAEPSPEEIYMTECLEVAETDATLQYYADGWGSTEIACGQAYESYSIDACSTIRRTKFDICFGDHSISYTDPETQEMRRDD